MALAGVDAWGSRRLVVSAAILVFVFSFLVFDAIERQFYSLGVTTQYNTIFDADPSCRLDGMANGWCNTGNRELRHPNIANILGTATRGAAALIGEVTGADELELRIEIARLYVPVFGALQCVAAFLLALLLEGGVAAALLMSGLNLVLFTNLIFSSLPEHFGISASLIAWGMLLSVWEFKRRRPAPFWVWLLLVSFGFAVTVTNLMFIGVQYFIAHVAIHRRPLRAFGLSVLLASLCVSANLAIHAAGGLAYGEPLLPRALETTVSATQTRDKVEALEDFLVAVSDSIAARIPGTVIDSDSLERQKRHVFRFTYDLGGTARPSVPGILIALNYILLLYGTYCMLREGPALRRYAALSAAAILFLNLTLHVFWGTEMILYSSHWVAALLVLLHGVTYSRYGRYMLAAATVYIGANNSFVLLTMFKQLH